MSGELALVIAATAAAVPAEPPVAPAPAVILLEPPGLATRQEGPLANALSLAIPSTDGTRGAQVTYERWLLDHRIAVGLSGVIRGAGEADYTAVKVGGGARVRRFWQAHHTPKGWFYGGGVTAATVATHDDVDDEWLGTTLQLGIAGELGYRIAPWRGLIVTPTAGLELHTDIDTSGRLSPWTRGGFTVGLEVGWMF